MSELRNIPNVGAATERDLIAMGYKTIESLKGKTAEELYSEECALRGTTIDRCQLYLYRAVVYWVNAERSCSFEMPLVVLEGRICYAFALRRCVFGLRSFSVRVRGLPQNKREGVLAEICRRRCVSRIFLL